MTEIIIFSLVIILGLAYVKNFIQIFFIKPTNYACVISDKFFYICSEAKDALSLMSDFPDKTLNLNELDNITAQAKEIVFYLKSPNQALNKFLALQNQVFKILDLTPRSQEIENLKKRIEDLEKFTFSKIQY